MTNTVLEWPTTTQIIKILGNNKKIYIRPFRLCFPFYFTCTFSPEANFLILHNYISS
jgi:hypothetical protein